MEAEKEIIGICPHCNNNTKFRELTFTENLTWVGGVIGSFFTGGLATKAKQSAMIINSFSDSRDFPNYKCGTCGGEVMQCGECMEIIPYEHDGSSHVCGAKKPKKQEKISSSLTDDIISKLERLAALKEKGILTEVEFNQQKSKLLG